MANRKVYETSFTDQVNQDGNASEKIMNNEISRKFFDKPINDDDLRDATINSDLYKIAIHGANLFEKDNIDLYNKIYRFGLNNPYGSITNLREYLFFTKPDLNIINRHPWRGDIMRSYQTDAVTLSEGLQNRDYWIDLKESRLNTTIKCLQNSFDPGWNKLLQNSVISNLELPALEGTSIESPVNNYGVGFHYRGTSEASNDSFDFSLEFKDTKYLDVYHFFKAYDEYEVLKHHGVVSPWEGYILNRVLHDQFAIYKFVVGEDAETLIYWAKLYGVMPMNTPRDVFSSTEMPNGLSYSINFKAAFIEDMTKDILIDFNLLSNHFATYEPNSTKYQYENYNDITHTVDFRPAKYACIERFKSNDAPGGFVYKLKWKGDEEF